MVEVRRGDGNTARHGMWMKLVQVLEPCAIMGDSEATKTTVEPSLHFVVLTVGAITAVTTQSAKMRAEERILGPPPRFAERILADFPTNRFTSLPPYLLLFTAWRPPPDQPRLALVLGSCCGIEMLIQKKKKERGGE